MENHYRLLLPASIAMNAIFLFAILTPFACAIDAANARLETLYKDFIAPCCWSKNLMEHNSEVASEMRSQIEAMVRAGRSDDEIKAVFVTKYGKRVLSLPEGSPRAWLFWTPVVVALGGLTVVYHFLRRSRRKHGGDIGAAELDADWDAGL